MDFQFMSEEYTNGLLRRTWLLYEMLPLPAFYGVELELAASTWITTPNTTTESMKHNNSSHRKL